MPSWLQYVTPICQADSHILPSMQRSAYFTLWQSWLQHVALMQYWPVSPLCAVLLCNHRVLCKQATGNHPDSVAKAWLAIANIQLWLNHIVTKHQKITSWNNRLVRSVNCVIHKIKYCMKIFIILNYPVSNAPVCCSSRVPVGVTRQ